MVAWAANALARNLNQQILQGRSYPLLPRRKGLPHALVLSQHPTHKIYPLADVRRNFIPILKLWPYNELSLPVSSPPSPDAGWEWDFNEVWALLYDKLSFKLLHDKCHCQCCGLHSLNYMTRPGSMEGQWSYLSVCVRTTDSILLLFKISCSDGKDKNLKL